MPTSIPIQFKQGTKAQLTGGLTGLIVGEPLFCNDSFELFVGKTANTTDVFRQDYTKFEAIGAVASDDLISMYDVSADPATPRQKRITFSDFKTALNIPAGVSDEKVACASGATAGYLGTTGSDGVLRTGTGIKITAGASNAYITLDLYFANEAQGDILFRGASGWKRLAAGAAGGLLQTNGAGANPTWATVISGGSFA